MTKPKKSILTWRPTTETLESRRHLTAVVGGGWSSNGNYTITGDAQDQDMFITISGTAFTLRDDEANPSVTSTWGDGSHGGMDVPLNTLTIDTLGGSDTVTVTVNQANPPTFSSIPVTINAGDGNLDWIEVRFVDTVNVNACTTNADGSDNIDIFKAKTTNVGTGTGDDIVVVRESRAPNPGGWSAQIDTGDDDDTVDCSQNDYKCIIYTGDGADMVFGSNGDDSITVTSGATTDNHGTPNYVWAGPGNDTITSGGNTGAGEAGDVIFGEADTDTFYYDTGTDSVTQ